MGAKAKGDFVEVGTGTVDFRGLADFYRQIGFDGWVMIGLDRYHKASIMESVRQMKEFVTDQLKLQFCPAATLGRLDVLDRAGKSRPKCMMSSRWIHWQGIALSLLLASLACTLLGTTESTERCSPRAR